MSEGTSPRDAAETDAQTHNYQPLAAKLQTVQDHVEDLEDEFPPHYQRELDHLADEIQAVDVWTATADAEGDVNALVGAPVIIDTAQVRVAKLQDELGQSGGDLRGRLEALANAVENVGDELDDLSITASTYVVYVNREFIARYDEVKVGVRHILEDAGRKDPSELGLFPLDGLFGARTEDLAFPPNKEIDLDAEHRTYFETTSDGGKIA